MIEIIEPWSKIESEIKINLENELKVEIYSQHILFNSEYDIIAKRIDCDDILLDLREKNKLAIVHLTWSGQTEFGDFPMTEILSVFDFNSKEKI